MCRLAIVLALCLAAPISAQTALGTITGAPVPNVEVTATAVATSVSFRSTSNESGAYVIPNVPIGQFSIGASATGFKQVTRTGINVEVARRLWVDITFELGGVGDSVEIRAEIPRVRTEDSSLGAVVERKRMTT